MKGCFQRDEKDNCECIFRKFLTFHLIYLQVCSFLFYFFHFFKYWSFKDFLNIGRRKNLQAGNYAKECHLNRAKPREVKNNPYKRSKKAKGKRTKHSCLLPHQSRVPSWLSTKPILLNRQYTEWGCFLIEKVFLI